VSDHLEIGDSRGLSEFNHPLTLTAEPGRELSLRVSYESSRFDRVSIGRLLGHLRVLLETMVAAPSRLSALPILTAAERHQLLMEWSATQAPQPEPSWIHHLFERQVARTPDAVAVILGNRALTYWELNRRANRLAHHLRAQGVGAETIVGIGVERSPEMVVGLLAVLKAGGAYLPFDPAYPKQRLAWMLNDSAAPVVLTQERLRDRIIERHRDADPAGDVASESPAYVIYTSGSTGRPKGVVVPHRALLNHTVSAGLDYGIGPDDRVLQFASISFDASAEEIYPALTRGATLVLRDDAMPDSVPRFLRAVDGYAISVLNLPTAYWHELCAALDDEALELPAPVRLVIVGGEKALADRLVRWRRRVGPRVRLVNTYGPTEATIVATRCELSGSEVPIGRPLAGVRVFLLDRLMRPVPMGVAGELHLGGVGLARGYLSRPRRTAERFVPNPLSGDPFGTGTRLYKTGDLARYLPDGNLEFLGRIDAQVKIRGFRVEPGEVEAILGRHAAVGEAVVVAREDVPGDRRLVAYLVARPELDRAELTRWLREKLPAHMMPSAFVVPEVVPRLPGGKVDRRALPASDGGRTPEDAFVAPRTPVEKTLAEIFSEVLSEEQVGLRDDFFALGGHSLLAVRLLGSIERRFEVRLPLAVLFRESTLQGLAGVIGEHRKSSACSVVQSSANGNHPRLR
ncbi:MAG: amino acid adenylation domain-containing protein, partial [bacterium]|nr:amino acid adenylation domain-containing protein [bacterium]